MNASGAYGFLHALLLVSEVRAMDMSGSPSSSNTKAMTMMIPYLHFTGGDHLFFKTVVPTSRGAIAGACIVLALLAILERAVAGARDHKSSKIFSQKTLLKQEEAGRQPIVAQGVALCVGKVIEIEGSSTATSLRASPTLITQPLPTQRQRSMAPLLWSCELARGGLFILQSFFLYAIMLAIMSFNAVYITSIILGTGIGEVLFGRFTIAQTH